MISLLRKSIAVILWLLGIMLLAIGVLGCLTLVGLIPGFICAVFGIIFIVIGLVSWPSRRAAGSSAAIIF